MSSKGCENVTAACDWQWGALLMMRTEAEMPTPVQVTTTSPEGGQFGSVEPDAERADEAEESCKRDVSSRAGAGPGTGQLESPMARRLRVSVTATGYGWRRGADGSDRKHGEMGRMGGQMGLERTDTEGIRSGGGNDLAIEGLFQRVGIGPEVGARGACNDCQQP